MRTLDAQIHISMISTFSHMHAAMRSCLISQLSCKIIVSTPLLFTRSMRFTG
jgi:hypothetical protein